MLDENRTRIRRLTDSAQDRARFSARADPDEEHGMHAACWTRTVLVALAAVPIAAQQHSIAFPSPDGSRVVRLALTRISGAKGNPALQIEYSMVGSSSEVLIRPFASSCGGSESARYRVAWDEGSRRFAVLASQVPGRAPSKVQRLSSGEYVLLTHDRETAAPARSSEFENWGIARWKSAGPASLPLREIDIAKPVSEYSGRTGTVANGISRQRVQNLTVHSNTQNFVPGRLAVTPTVEVLASQRAPATRFEGRLARAESPTVLLAEGDAFFDQQWVILYGLPEERLQPKDGVSPRLVWSHDGRYVLVVTPPCAQPGFARLPGSEKEEVFLLFDVQQWQGTVAPAAAVLGTLQLAK